MPDTDIQRCSACGAPLDAPSEEGKIKCAYCHAINVVRPQEKRRWDSIQCPKCGTDNPREAQHCGHCGFELKFNCPNCNALNPYGTAYCLRCGMNIQAELKSQEEEERLEEEEESQSEEEFQQYQEEQKKSSQRRDRNIIFLIIGILAAILACFAAFSGIGKHETSTSPQDKQAEDKLSGWGATVAALHTATSAAHHGGVTRQTIARQTIAQRTAVARQTIAAQTATAGYSILFHDDFSTSSSGWDVYDDGTSSASYERGGYRLRVFDSTRMMGGIQSKVFQTNVHVEVDVNRLDESDDSYYGIVCRVQDADNFYMFIVLNDGHAFIIGRSLQGKITAISSGEGGQNETNNTLTNSSAHIRADCNGNELTFYVNGIQVAKATDDTLQTGKQVGLMAGANGNEETDILFDNFYVYRP